MSGRAFAENRKTCAGAVRKSSAQGWKIVSFFSAFLYKKQNVLYKNADSLYKKNQNLLVFCSSFPEDFLGGMGRFCVFPTDNLLEFLEHFVLLFCCFG